MNSASALDILINKKPQRWILAGSSEGACVTNNCLGQMNTSQNYGLSPFGASAPQPQHIVLAALSAQLLHSIGDFENHLGFQANEGLTAPLFEQHLLNYVEFIGQHGDLDKEGRITLFAFAAIALNSVKLAVGLRDQNLASRN